MIDLFGQVQQDDFHWVVGMFTGNGATDAIRRANQVPLRTYYPIRFNGKGEPVPLWRNYLFIEYREDLTSSLCRATKKFIKVLSMRDDEGNQYPIRVRRNAIDMHMQLLMKGKFDDKTFLRRFYGRGSLVRVVEGTFIDKRVRLEIDVTPDLPGNSKIPININGFKGSIDLWKLAL